MDKAAAMVQLPGDHHFYVTFRTHQHGVQMEDWLKDKFPEEMTIVIQHQYDKFAVQEEDIIALLARVHMLVVTPGAESGLFAV